jgi:hypothetical protein
VTDRVRVREIDDDEGQRLVRIIRRGAGSVVTWRRAQMVLLSAQGMDVAATAKVAFTSQDRVRDVIRNGLAGPDCSRLSIRSELAGNHPLQMAEHPARRDDRFVLLGRLHRIVERANVACCGS